MPKIYLNPKFHGTCKQFVRRNSARKRHVYKTLLCFRNNPSYPSLHIEKLSHSDIWTIRLDKGNRLFFFWNKTKDTAIFFFVGHHDAYKTIGKK
ncbi:MAG: hypothetical protein UV63_C0036G0013 [Microgenomates group bacterium GW2011_GWC1_43_11]|uniref:Plasmid stabilization system n=2 Tax=Candidatus Gottesmaniibacteriota TaxID=1752720 RepID=A0A0G1IP00_9BACT|nr:MAG: hypothetical protein UV63_C0036G0013 [Microgenomates group bacterium GW2011_GWC1_43_11]KKT38042.1 MAG: hypothetical protein UW22_C0014G0001 [Candidatus Gottesmanbacteria bacterium GW2011_GWB1_44_11c]KKT60653.1 MAG: hypothetical protein UW52_C0020G0011 [Candidatus Gottesmanbacteria bacterium GW2011_GWA1_44_24b]HCM81868.1 hypothetical protein [Patescibacteria group bacterium]